MMALAGVDLFFFKKTGRTNEHKLDSNKDIIFNNKHKFKAMYMYLRQFSGRGLLNYPQVFYFFC